MVFAMYCTGTNVDWVVGRSWVGKPKIIPLIVLKQSNVTITIQAQHTPHHENRQKKRAFSCHFVFVLPYLVFGFRGLVENLSSVSLLFKAFFSNPTEFGSRRHPTVVPRPSDAMRSLRSNHRTLKYGANRCYFFLLV